MTTNVTRRLALTSGLAAGAAACATTPDMTSYTAASESTGGVFAHGVASGDPDQTSIVLWTRLSVDQTDALSAEVTVEIAETSDFSSPQSTTLRTSAARDWTVKHLANDLAPGRTYYFRFTAGGVTSPIGRTKTLPVGAVNAARFAICSCSNYPFGYFNVYDLIAREDNIDAVLHLGDYLYEYDRQGYGGDAGAALSREHEPATEIVSLSDYRQRHAQYKSDPSAQAMHAKHAMIAVWDDHETANDSWKGGAENHSPETEGDWNARRRAALQAYYEWMPVREPDGTPEAFFRSFEFGDLLTLAAIETRLMARSRQFEYSEIVPTLKSPEDVTRFRNDILWDSSREMLGDAQLDYLDRTIRMSVEAGKPWRLIANQVIMAEVIAPDLSPHVTEEDLVELEQQWDQARAFVEFSKLGLPTNLDAWDGYPAARERFYDLVRKAGDDGMIVVTGDTHTWWANDLNARDGKSVGVELGVNSVTSPSPYARSFLGGKGAEYALLTNQDNKSVRYLSGENHGYIYLEITKENARAEYRAVDNIESPAYRGFVKAAFDIGKSSDGVKFTDADYLGFKEGFLF